MQEAKHGLFLIGGLLLGVLLQLLGCALWKNWWPLLNAIFYVLVPMPWMLFGTDSDAANDPDVQGWVDAGKFLTGASAVGTIAIPAILFHAGKIVVGSFLCELAAALVLGTTAVAYLNLGSSDEYMAW